MRSIILLMCFAILACESGDRLDQAIRDGLESGVRNDSLFLGLKFGMTAEEFYKHCWDLNRKQLVKEGSNNTSVLYLFEDEKGREIEFNFYPEFSNDGVAYLYDTSFNYYGWAPWNHDLQSEDMLDYLPELFDKWYGKGNTISRMEQGKEVFYRIDGNRKIEMRIHNERYVKVTFTDMSKATL